MYDKFLLAIQESIMYKDSALCRLSPEIMREFKEQYETPGLQEKLNGLQDGLYSLSPKTIKEIKERYESFDLREEQLEGIINSEAAAVFDRKEGYILTVFMYLFLMHKNLEATDFYDTPRLQELFGYISGVNTCVSSLLMDYDFDTYGNLNFEDFYMPHVRLLKYVDSINRTQTFIRKAKIKGIKSENLIKDYDLKFLGTSYAFMEIQAILLLMEIGTPYSQIIHKIARQILIVFKDLLVNARIEKIMIDPAIAAKAKRSGFKKTTGIKIFFALENMDNYCLRIDFPHKGEEYFHYNLHEPGRTTALPLKPFEYRALVKKYGLLPELFFEFEGKFWFRNNFIKKLQSKYGDEKHRELRADLEKLFHEKAHYQMFNGSIERSEMECFIVEFGTALSHMNFGEFLYEDTGQNDIDEEMRKMKLQEIVFDIMMQYYNIKVIEELDDCEFKEETEKLKSRFVEILFKSFTNAPKEIGSKEECFKMELEDLLGLVSVYCLYS